ncbi:MAG: pentapeptide repeat-containing protein [Candidatus Scalindua sp.]|jgi:uncharacterized protein YjbI with pentapeptide repeats
MANFTREDVIEKVRKGEGLRSAVLYGIDLSNANLRSANLSRANLRSTNLMDADLSSADLSGASLHGADLRSANLRGANLGRANLSSANLIGSDLSSADLNRADLNRTDLSNAYFHSVNLRGANLSGAYLHSTNLSRADLSGANLSRANLSSTNLMNADLSSADLGGANLSSANLRDADIKNSFLISADLEYADLTKADISGSNILHYKTHGWKIEGIRCTHVYNYPQGASGSERRMSRINFEKGQFEEKYRSTPILEFLLSGAPQLSDQCKMYYIIKKVNKKYNTGLEPASMKKESDGMLITLGAKSDQHLEEIGHMFVQEYKKHDLDSKLLTIIEKEELLSSGVDSLDASDLFKQLLRVRVTLVNKGTINIIKE